ncbi:hypothetical protein BD560DRAFT_446380 [Blakeslea trispora]|nr:hypothetical protein BD560DRAFT_446380 [Blakeslea trispora]
MISIPTWTIFVIIIATIMTILSGAYYVFRKRISKKKTTVGTQESTQDHVDKTFNNAYNDDIEANMEKQKELPSTTPLSMLKSSCSQKSYLSKESRKPTDDTLPVMPSPVHHKKEKDNTDLGTIKIHLPLPPPCSSFFSDKMELNSDEANYLFEAYSQRDLSPATEERDLMSIAAANIQSTAATIKSTLRQSLRRKKSTAARHTPIHQYFPTNLANMQHLSSDTSISRQLSRASSRKPLDEMSSRNTPSLTPDSLPSTPNTTQEYFSSKAQNSFAECKSVRDMESNKIMIEDAPLADYDSTASASSCQSHHPNSSLIDLQDNAPAKATERSESSDEAENEELTTPQEVASAAARKIIRSASRKSRTRSVISTHVQHLDSGTQGAVDRQRTVYATLRDTSRKESQLDQADMSKADQRLLTSSASGPITTSGKKANRIQELQRAFQDDSSTRPNSHSSDRPSSLKKLGANKGHKSLKSLFEPFENAPCLDQVSPSDRLTQSKTDHDSFMTAPLWMAVDDQNDNAKATSPTAKSSPSESGNNVDTIRRMLRSSWSGNNLRQSGSNQTLSAVSDMDSIGSSYLQPSPLGSTNPRLQNRHLMSLSLTSTVQRARPSMPIGFMSSPEGPVPTASFSSSTARTMIPAEEIEETTIRQLEVQESHRQNPSGMIVECCLKDVLQPTIETKTAAQREREKYLKSIQA